MKAAIKTAGKFSYPLILNHKLKIMNSKIVIIDGNAVVYRAYHALPKLTAKNGKIVNAVYGFLLVLFRTIKELTPDYMAIAFDVAGPTFRDKIYRDYKAKRPPAPQELYDQIPLIKEILSSFNIKIFEKEGFEADDIIGTISVLAKRTQIYPAAEVIIVTGDSDSFQLINDQTKVCFLKKGVKETALYDISAIKEKYQIAPSQLPDFKGLSGDAADNIPGISGIGIKTAIKLIGEFGNLEDLFQNIEDRTEKSRMIAPKVKSILERSKKQAFFSRMLSQIKTDVPINFNLSVCKIKNLNQDEGKKALEKFNFKTLIKRLDDFRVGRKDSPDDSKKEAAQKKLEF